MAHNHIHHFTTTEVHTEDAVAVNTAALLLTSILPAGCSSCCGLMTSTMCARGMTSDQGDVWVVRRSFKWTTAGHIVWTGITNKAYTGKEDAGWDVDFAFSVDTFQVNTTGDAAEHVEWTCFSEWHINADS